MRIRVGSRGLRHYRVAGPVVLRRPAFCECSKMPTLDSSTHRMQCMEIWGGNQSVDSAVAMAGLDAWVYSRPYRPGQPDDPAAEGGGDVHYVSSCASGRITRLLVADVSGHGESVSTIALQLRTLMRRYVNYISPAKFMEAMNARFTSLTEVGCFATAVVATYYAPTRVLSLGNAGHPAPLIYRAATASWSLLERPTDSGASHADLPLGIIEKTSYATSQVTLERGDMILCYTDSLIECRDAQGKLLGQAGLLNLVKTISVVNPARVIPALLASIEGIAPGNLDLDDVTALLFTPNNQRSSLKDNLLAPIRVVGQWLGRLRPGSEVVH